jgi:hypothetical protein
MKNFELTKDMLTMGGTFYPKNYAVVMFPDKDSASQVAGEVDSSLGGEVMLLDPPTIIRQIGRMDGDNPEVPLPSVGTEGATVSKYVQLARNGHHAVMVKIDSDEAQEKLMESARKAAFSYGQLYHLLAIQDLE